MAEHEYRNKIMAMFQRIVCDQKDYGFHNTNCPENEAYQGGNMAGSCPTCMNGGCASCQLANKSGGYYGDMKGGYNYYDVPALVAPASTYEGLNEEQKLSLWQQNIDNGRDFAIKHNYPKSLGNKHDPRLRMKEKDYNVPIANDQHSLSQLPKNQDVVSYRDTPEAAIIDEDNKYLSAEKKQKKQFVNKSLNGGKRMKNPNQVAKGKKIAGQSAWVKHVKQVAAKYGISYKQAMIKAGKKNK